MRTGPVPRDRSCFGRVRAPQNKIRPGADNAPRCADLHWCPPRRLDPCTAALGRGGLLAVGPNREMAKPVNSGYPALKSNRYRTLDGGSLDSTVVLSR